MPNLWFVLLNMSVAGFVGGVTNHLAIKMLFHPRTEWRVGGMRVPFTPGLIPKRKEEIGQSLGKVVGDYLVTSQGLVSMLRKPETQARLEGAMSRFVTDWTHSPLTVREVLSRWMTPEEVESAAVRLSSWLADRTEQGVQWLWQEKGYGELKLSSLLPEWTEEKREALVDWGANMLVEEIKKEILSPNGERMLRQMTNQFMGQTGGFLGALAGMFMDESKTIDKIRMALLQQLESPVVYTTLANFIRKKAEQFERMSLAELLTSVAKQDSLAMLQDKARTLLPWEQWLARGLEIRVDETLGPYEQRLLEFIPGTAARALDLLAVNTDRIMEAVQLPKLVEEQVSKFPIERLEDIILSVSGKEFRAITWLGVLLGAIIGLIQSLLLPMFSVS